MNINQRIEQLEKELQELKEQVVIQEQAETKTPIGWVPEENGFCFYVGRGGDISYGSNTTTYDRAIIEYTKVFKTEEEAQFYAEKMKVERELEKFASEFVCGEFNYSIFWDYAIEKFRYQKNKVFIGNLTYFESKEKAQEAIQAVGEDRIKKYYLEVE